MLLIIVGLLVFSCVILLFASPKLSPIPYFPSNSKDIPLIIDLLNVKNNQVILDLGAGDGKVIFKAAGHSFQKKLNTEYIAVESNPILWIVIWIKRLFHPNKKRIHIVLRDLFKINYKQKIDTVLKEKKYSSTFYYYFTPWLIESVYKHITKTISQTTIVSYFYPLKIKATKQMKGKNTIYLYTIKK
jgi:16S rRNA A1518/A1519 N6-dimethyltransferase RsmA/KsgA/DIM1 with predicted DNA glycosylase/AP lyase activity